ncbi:MAG TPA: hypothetical protein VMF53_04400 [Alphaproteobacteria bacterium]|nr:hypothetical protein [Alphaproteobacteria bacterium]
MAQRSRALSGEDEAESLFATYADYNRALRTWFVSFGIGGPALFLSDSTLARSLEQSGQAGRVVGAFLVGCALQILVALINKIGAWYSYSAKRDGAERGATLWEAFWLRLYSQFWVDIACDLATLAAFAFAVVELIAVVAAR